MALWEIYAPTPKIQLELAVSDEGGRTVLRQKLRNAKRLGNGKIGVALDRAIWPAKLILLPGRNFPIAWVHKVGKTEVFGKSILPDATESDLLSCPWERAPEWLRRRIGRL